MSKEGKKPEKLKLSKKTISALDSATASRVVGGDDSITRIWTPTYCSIPTQAHLCPTSVQTGCASC